MLRHQRDGLSSGRRRLLHVLLAIQLVPCIEKNLVVAVADQRIQLSLGKASVQIDLCKIRPGLAKKTLRVAAARSSRLEVKRHHTYRGTDGSTSRLQRSIPPS